MTKKQVNKLHAGDEVFWNDPDEGLCSRHYVIQNIRCENGIVIITDTDGASLECFASELS